MKITDIRAFPTRVGHRNQCIVKVETDEGIHGWGESGLSGRELAVVGAIRHYREFLLGADPLRIGALWQQMYRSQYFEGGRVLSAAISAIDIALHDVAGKALGVPVYQLLGGRQRDFVPCFATTMASGPQLLEDAQRLLEAGWSAIRTFPNWPGQEEDPTLFEPRASIGPTATWLTRLREEIGPDPILGIDYHHRLSVAEAASFCQRMPSGTLDFLEEPIRDETPEAYESLRTMTDVPFAIGEEMSSKWPFLPLPRARHHPVRPARRVQRRRPHRGHEGGEPRRGPLPRPDAPQPPGTDLHRSDHPPGGGGAQLRLARGPHLTDRGAGPRRCRPVSGPASTRG